MAKKFIKRSERAAMEAAALPSDFTEESISETAASKQRLHTIINKYGAPEANTEQPETAPEADEAASADINADFRDGDDVLVIDTPTVAEEFRPQEEFDPVPESQPEIRHRIHKVQLEHSEPGAEPEEGKFAANTVEVELPDSSDKLPAESTNEKTKKFIKAEPPADVPSAKDADDAADGASPKKSRHAPQIDASPIFVKYPEYNHPDSKAEIIKFLTGEKKKYRVKLAVCGAATLITVILSVIADVTSARGFLGIFGGNGVTFGVTMLVLFLIGVLPLLNEFSGAFALLKKKQAGSDAAVLLLWAAALLQNILLLTAPAKIQVQCRPYNAAVLVITLVMGITRLITLTRMTAGFKILSAGKGLHGIGAVADSHRSERIGQGILEPDAKIGYAFRTSFIDNYINAALTDDPAIPLCTLVLPACLIAALVVAVATGIVAKDFHKAITALAAIITVTSPIPVSITLRALLNARNTKLASSGGVIPDYASALAFSANDAFILDAADIYDADALDILGARAFNGYSLYDAILYTAAMLIESTSPLGGIFLQAIDGREELLPKCDSVLYEEKQGLSGWIVDNKVLVGTRDMLLNHNIEVIPEEKELKYLDAYPNRRILYLAIDGKPAALFLTSYDISQENADALHYLSKHGYTILLRSTDPNINESFTESQLSLQNDTVKVINAEAAEYFRLCREESIANAPTGAFSAGNVAARLKLAVSAVRLKNAFSITRLITIVGSVLGLLMVALLMILGSAASVAGYYLLLLQALWTVIGIAVCKLTEKRQ